MIPETLSRIEIELRRASAQHRYRDVDRLALAFGDSARGEISSLAPGDPAVAEIAQHVLEVLEWSRVITLTGRAMTAADLRGIPFLKKYVNRPPRPPMVRMDA